MAKTARKQKNGPAKAKGSSTTKVSSADAAIANSLKQGRQGSRKKMVGKENNSHPKQDNVQPSSSDHGSDGYESLDSRQGIQYTEGNSDNSDVQEGKWIVDTVSWFSP